MKKIIIFTLSFMLTGFISYAANNLNSYESGKPIISNLFDFYKNLDLEKLHSDDEAEIIEYITEKNTEIKEYLVETYPEESFDELDVEDPGTFIIGFLTAIAEENNFELIEFSEGGLSGPSIILNPIANSLPTWAACAIEIVAGVFDVVSLYNEYVTLFSSSATSWTSVASVVGKTLKRHFGWIAAAYLVYDISTTCF